MVRKELIKNFNSHLSNFIIARVTTVSLVISVNNSLRLPEFKDLLKKEIINTRKNRKKSVNLFFREILWKART